MALCKALNFWAFGKPGICSGEFQVYVTVEQNVEPVAQSAGANDEKRQVDVRNLALMEEIA